MKYLCSIFLLMSGVAFGMNADDEYTALLEILQQNRRATSDMNQDVIVQQNEGILDVPPLVDFDQIAPGPADVITDDQIAEITVPVENFSLGKSVENSFDPSRSPARLKQREMSMRRKRGEIPAYEQGRRGVYVSPAQRR